MQKATYAQTSLPLTKMESPLLSFNSSINVGQLMKTWEEITKFLRVKASVIYKRTIMRPSKLVDCLRSIRCSLSSTKTSTINSTMMMMRLGKWAKLEISNSSSSLEQVEGMVSTIKIIRVIIIQLCQQSQAIPNQRWAASSTSLLFFSPRAYFLQLCIRLIQQMNRQNTKASQKSFSISKTNLKTTQFINSIKESILNLSAKRAHQQFHVQIIKRLKIKKSPLKRSTQILQKLRNKISPKTKLLRIYKLQNFKIKSLMTIKEFHLFQISRILNLPVKEE